MWRGRGFRGFGLGFGFRSGLGLGFAGSFGPRFWGPNFYLNCRRFPWLPRWWWANPAYSQIIPSTNMAYTPTIPITPIMTKTQEKEILTSQLSELQKTIENIKQRLNELETL